MKLQSRKAFTLLEIMIVVAVIGLLALIAIPSIMQSRKKTRRGLCCNNQRILREGVVEFAFVEGATELQEEGMTPEKILARVFELGYVKENAFDCPAEAAKDHNDYRLVILGGGGSSPPDYTASTSNVAPSGSSGGGGPEKLWIECLVKPEEHTMEGGGPQGSSSGSTDTTADSNTAATGNTGS